MRLKDKVIIVTGGAAGLGKAMCLRCAREGANIVVADTNLDKAKEIAAETVCMGVKAIAVKVDVSRKDQVQAMVSQTVKIMGHIDVLVNNAGIFSNGDTTEYSEEKFDRMMDVNIKGVFLCSQAVLRHMVEKKIRGCLIHMSSITGFVAFPGSVAYCASKGAVLQISKVLALEFGPLGIRSNVIAPGTFDTDMNAWLLDKPENLQNTLKLIPLGRIGKPEEIASTVVFLASEEGSYFNGAVLLQDGGQITHI